MSQTVWHDGFVCSHKEKKKKDAAVTQDFCLFYDFYYRMWKLKSRFWQWVTQTAEEVTRNLKFTTRLHLQTDARQATLCCLSTFKNDIIIENYHSSTCTGKNGSPVSDAAWSAVLSIWPAWITLSNVSLDRRQSSNSYLDSFDCNWPAVFMRRVMWCSVTSWTGRKVRSVRRRAVNTTAGLE